jgi:hypothetical protein
MPKRNFEQMGSGGPSAEPRRVPRLANLRAAHNGSERPALTLTHYFCNRGVEQPTAEMRQLLLLVSMKAVRLSSPVSGS